MSASLPELERFEAAIQEGEELVEAGDSPMVAANAVALKHDVDDRFNDLVFELREVAGDA